MLKLSQPTNADSVVTLKLEGSLSGLWVDEVRRTCEELLAEGRAFVLDLSEVWFLDAAGVALVCQLKSRGVIWKHCSPFVAEQLKG